MWRGRYQLGDEAVIGVLCRNGSGTPVAPDAAPTAKVYNSTGTKVAELSIPPKDIARATGLFEHFVRLGSDFAAGVYSVVYSWSASGYTGGDVDWFEIAPGGDEAGTVISMTYFETANAGHLVQQLDSGRIKTGKNPYV